MSARARLKNRTRIFRQHVQMLVSQLDELNSLRAQVLRVEEGIFCTRLKNGGRGSGEASLSLEGDGSISAAVAAVAGQPSTAEKFGE